MAFRAVPVSFAATRPLFRVAPRGSGMDTPDSVRPERRFHSVFRHWRFGRETGGVVETDRDEAHDLLDAAWERGINFIDTANVYGNPNGPRSVHRRVARRPRPRELRHRLEGVLPLDRGEPGTAPVSSASTSAHRSRARWTASTRTISTSTTSIAGTSTATSRRRCRRSTTSSARARSTTSARRRWPPGN